MTTREYQFVVINDTTVVEMEAGKPAHVLDDRRTKLMLRALGLTKDPVLVPARSLELAKERVDDDDKPVTGTALRLLSVLAEYNEPITARAMHQLMSEENSSTLSSRLSDLKKKGYVSAHGVPSQYIVTGEGHDALRASAAAELEKGKGRALDTLTHLGEHHVA